MTQRSALLVFVLTLVTFGLYTFYWAFVTAAELNEQGAEVPHPIVSLVPFVNLWWLWRFSKAVAMQSEGAWSPLLAYVVLLLLPGIGSALVQSSFNRRASTAVGAAA